MTFKIVNKNENKPVWVWIGDPCYVISNEEWDDFCFAVIRKLDYKTGDFIETEHGTIFVWGTKYGDGTYKVKKNGKNIGYCPVDSGLLSVFPLDVAKKYLSISELEGNGVITEVKEFTPVAEDNDMKMKGILVKTS